MKKLNFILALCLMTLFTVKINAQEITSFSGFWGQEYYQDDKELTKHEFKNLLNTNNEAATYLKRAETNAAVAYAAYIAQMGFVVWTASELEEDNGSTLGPALGTIGLGIIGAIFLHQSNKNNKKAILTYNKQFDNKTSFRLVPTSNRNGIGIALKF